ncbi:MAG: thioredoxin domain-containing protein [Gemmatimonadota bacterium]
MQFGSWKIAIGLVAVVGVVWTLSERPTYGGAVSADPEVLAIVGGVPLTRSEVESTNPEQFSKLQQQLFTLTEQSLEQVIEARLVGLEAESRGMTSDELLFDEVESKVPQPTATEVDAFYADRKEQISGTYTREAIGPQIVELLIQQARTGPYNAFLAELRAKYEVSNLLEPPRFVVATEGFPSKGPSDAPVTIVEFGDFECPFCYRLLESLNQVDATYGDKVRLVYRQFPLNSIHPHAQKAAEASLCAAEQGRFWELHDDMFLDQTRLRVRDLKAAAVRLGMDGERFNSCLDSGKYVAEIATDVEAGMRLGINGTPALYINGRFLLGAQPFEVIATIIDDELRRADRG